MGTALADVAGIACPLSDPFCRLCLQDWVLSGKGSIELGNFSDKLGTGRGGQFQRFVTLQDRSDHCSSFDVGVFPRVIQLAKEHLYPLFKTVQKVLPYVLFNQEPSGNQGGGI